MNEDSNEDPINLNFGHFERYGSGQKENPLLINKGFSQGQQKTKEIVINVADQEREFSSEKTQLETSIKLKFTNNRRLKLRQIGIPLDELIVFQCDHENLDLLDQISKLDGIINPQEIIFENTPEKNPVNLQMNNSYQQSKDSQEGGQLYSKLASLRKERFGKKLQNGKSTKQTSKFHKNKDEERAIIIQNQARKDTRLKDNDSSNTSIIKHPLIRAVSNDLSRHMSNLKKKRKLGKDNLARKDRPNRASSKDKLFRAQSNIHQSLDHSAILQLSYQPDSKDSNNSVDSNGITKKKSCLLKDDTKIQRKASMSGAKVRFNKELGEYNELEEESKTKQGNKKLKKGENFYMGNDQVIVIRIQKRPKKTVTIKADDPLVTMTYPKYYLSEKVELKTFTQIVASCKTQSQNVKDRFTGSKLQKFQQQLIKNAKLSFQNNNKSKIQELKDVIKMSNKKNTLMTVSKKNNEISGYDASAYVKFIGHTAYKLYLNYRPYVKEMLSELKQDFELILMCSKNQQYTEQISSTLQKEENYFDYVINKEMLYETQDSGFHTLDLKILLGSRELKDIIIVSHSCERHLFHVTSGVPVKQYTGSKKDLSLYSLSKYLRQFKEVKDVRTKIAEDFNL